MNIERVEIKGRGFQVPGILVSPASPKGAAVIAHGYGGCKEELLGLAWRVAEHGLAACTIDLRGHGEHQLTMDDEFLADMEATIRYCRTFGKVVAIGHSLGGRLALLSDADYAIGISPPLDPDYCARTRELLHKVRSYRVKQERPSAVFDYLKSLPATGSDRSGRTLIIYGSRDVAEIVDSCNDLRAKGGNVLRIEEARHGDTHQLESTFSAIANQLAKWFEGRGELRDRTLITHGVDRAHMFIPCSGTKTHDALPGVVRRQAAVAKGVQLIEFRMSRGAVIPWHDHVNEQVGMVVSGRIVLTIGKDAMTLGPGDGYVIPSGVEHTVEVLEDSVALDVFSPPRDDYRDLIQ